MCDKFQCIGLTIHTLRPWIRCKAVIVNDVSKSLTLLTSSSSLSLPCQIEKVSWVVHKEVIENSGLIFTLKTESLKTLKGVFTYAIFTVKCYTYLEIDILKCH